MAMLLPYYMATYGHDLFLICPYMPIYDQGIEGLATGNEMQWMPRWKDGAHHERTHCNSFSVLALLAGEAAEGLRKLSRQLSNSIESPNFVHADSKRRSQLTLETL